MISPRIPGRLVLGHSILYRGGRRLYKRGLYDPGRQTRRGDPDALRRGPAAIGLGRPLTAEAPGGVPDARGVEGGPVREVRGA